MTNGSAIPANCDFQVLSEGFGDDMHNFYVMPFKSVMKPGDSIGLTLCIRCNWKNYDKKEIDQRAEMRKLLNIKITDTKLNIIVPLYAKFMSKASDDSD